MDIGNPEHIRALLVDDDDVDRERMVRLLKHCRSDIHVVEAVSKETALHELRERAPRFSFIFLDFKLDDGDGRDLLPEIWEAVGADCVVVAVTGNGNEQAAADAIKLGIHDYLCKKDLSADRLSSAIEEGLLRIEHNHRLREAEQDLLHKSLHDALTDLPNRHVFFDRLEQRCLAHHREANPFAVIMIDLNKFKDINDTHGHAAGDGVLIESAHRLRSAVRDMDTIARLGGDEFAVILPSIHSLNVALTMAGRLISELEQPLAINGTVLNIGATAGIAVCPQHGNDPSTLVRRADDAMYRGKRSSTKVVLYDEQEPASSNFLDRMVLLGEAELALNHGDIHWFWQPKVNLDTRVVEGFEVLARWTHPVHGPVPTEDFIVAVENSPLILPFTLATIDDVLCHIGALDPRLSTSSVSFNVSARVLEHDNFVDALIQRIENSHVPPQRIVLELTETALICNPIKAREIINRLNAYGVSLSIDDFGAGFTSFGYLRDFKVHEIKIDKAYITRLTDNQFDRSLVSCLTVFCESLGINPIAEGVETDQCWQALLDLGCHHGQGYGIGRPMPFADITGWLNRWTAPH